MERFVELSERSKGRLKVCPDFFLINSVKVFIFACMEKKKQNHTKPRRTKTDRKEPLMKLVSVQDLLNWKLGGLDPKKFKVQLYRLPLHP